MNLTTAIAHRATTRSLLGMTGHHRAADSDFAHRIAHILFRNGRSLAGHVLTGAGKHAA